MSLSEHFFAAHGRAGPACEAAQRAFAESLAGYSLVCYLLQIKVRTRARPCLPGAPETYYWQGQGAPKALLPIIQLAGKLLLVHRGLVTFDAVQICWRAVIA